MENVPKFIYDVCPSCKPQTDNMTIAQYTGEIENTGDFNEYLYVCVNCGARVWVDESWAMSHAVKGGVNVD